MLIESIISNFLATGIAESTPAVASGVLFPFMEYWWLYGGFMGFVLAMLALDLGVFHRQAHVVGIKEAVGWSVVWITLALVFNVLLWQYAQSKFGADIGSQVGLEFLTGYLIEKALSVDNVFVFALVFGYFSIPPQYQHRVLFWGILVHRCGLGADAIPLGGVAGGRLPDRDRHQDGVCRRP